MKKLLLLAMAVVMVGCPKIEPIEIEGINKEPEPPHDDGEVKTTAEEEDVPPPKEPESKK